MCVLVIQSLFVSDRLEKEREILEERADKRVEILKNLVSKTVELPAVSNSSKVVKTRPLVCFICYYKLLIKVLVGVLG